MSWMEIFPFLSPDLIQESEEVASPEDRSFIGKCLNIERIVNPIKRKKLTLSLSVGKDDDIDLLINSSRGIVGGFSQIRFRIYVASDVDAKDELFSEAGFEVYRMTSNSQFPGLVRFWPLLALAERGGWVSPICYRRIGEAAAREDRSKITDGVRLFMWRYNSGHFSPPLPQGYWPVISNSFGCKGGLPIAEWFSAAVIHSKYKSIENTCYLPHCGARTIENNSIDSPFFSEWLMLLVYPYLSKKGVLSIVPFATMNPLFSVDLEYTTWSNSRSELAFMPASGFACC